MLEKFLGRETRAVRQQGAANAQKYRGARVPAAEPTGLDVSSPPAAGNDHEPLPKARRSLQKGGSGEKACEISGQRQTRSPNPVPACHAGTVLRAT